VLNLEMRICIIGGLGTLGGDVIDAYQELHEILVIDDAKESSVEEDVLPKNVKCLITNVASADLLENALKEFDPDVVLFLATTLSRDQTRGLESVIGMQNVIRIANDTSKFPILYIQSFLTRDPVEPISASSGISIKDSYSVWKYASELLLNEYTGKKMTVILSSVVSPRITIGAIPAFTKKILANEKLSITNTHRDYLTPRDFMTFLDSVLEKENWPLVCAVGSATSVSTIEIAEAVAKALGREFEGIDFDLVSPKSTDPDKIVFDNTVAENYFDWSPRGHIETAIRDCVTQIVSSNKSLRQHHG
jgi:nucleoside-diphosphate-sugar epimerase